MFFLILFLIQNKCISIALYFICFVIFLVISHAVLLSMCMGVGGCGCPKLTRVLHIVIAVCAFRWISPSSATTADAHTMSKNLHRIWMYPSNQISWLGCGYDPRKKSPQVVLYIFGSERYDPSECICNIIWLVLYLIRALDMRAGNVRYFYKIYCYCSWLGLLLWKKVKRF